MGDFSLTPIIALPLLLLLLAVVVVVMTWSFRFGLRSRSRSALLWALRLAALVVLLVVMLQPQQRHDEVIPVRTQLAVLIDSSESMAEPVDETQPKRADRVKEWLQSPALQEARRDLDVRVFTFDQSVNEQAPDAKGLEFKGPRSNLLGSIAQVQQRLHGQPVAGILLLSDGLDTVSANPRNESVSSSVPVYAFELEKPFKPKPRQKRVAIVNVDYPQRVVVGWDTEVRVTVVGSGMSGLTVPMELWRDGRKLRDATVSFNEDEQTRDTAFALQHEKPGRVQYELRVTDEAADKQSRSYPFLIEVLEPGNRILYVQNTLGFDFKFLRKAITSDRNLQLNAYVRWSDNRLIAFGESGLAGAQSALDISGQSLSRFAVVILGDLPPDVLKLSQYEAIRDFVNKGGGLVLLGGGNGLASPALARTPLKDILPVKIAANAEYREGQFPVEITDAGLHHAVFGPLFAKVRDFPPLLTCNLVDGVAPLSETLMQIMVNGKLQPAVVAMRYGQGRVVVVLTDTIWRWRLAAKSWPGDRSPYDTFWAQLMDWLIPKEKKQQNVDRLEVFTERTNYLLGEKPEIRAILNLQAAGAKPPATLLLQMKAPDEKMLEYTLRPATLQTADGRSVPGYRAEVEPHVAGVYTGKAVTTIGNQPVEGETRFVVTRPVTEMTGKPINRELLQRIAETSKGKYYALEDWAKWRNDLHYVEQHVSRVQILDLWNHPAMLIVLLGLLAAEWTTRKFWSLP